MAKVLFYSAFLCCTNVYVSRQFASRGMELSKGRGLDSLLYEEPMDLSTVCFTRNGLVKELGTRHFASRGTDGFVDSLLHEE